MADNGRAVPPRRVTVSEQALATPLSMPRRRPHHFVRGRYWDLVIKWRDGIWKTG
ncbi:hypothetical protein GCM10010218_19910 [Streptomyces mashuensis]|uniref:Uncharacterized protein n=1 Tax=Streptomyces mashuensis TaxID=33904 RepID=A0A919B110_9ACTN|nr:hypothetical protein GCM10010218_19910 [Streptomyces mashuensis]